MGNGRVLVVDDDAFFRIASSDILTGAGFHVQTASSGTEAINLIEHGEFDVVVTDLVMPDISGLEVLEKAKQINALLDVIVVTGHSSIDTAVAALKKGAFDYIRKPLNADELILAIKGCLEKKALIEENFEIKHFLKLYEVSRSLASTLELNRLYSLSLDAMLQIVPAEAGILVFYEQDMAKLDIKAERHIALSSASTLVQAFSQVCGVELKNLSSVMVISKNEAKWQSMEELKAYGSMLLAPVVKGADAIGFFMLLSKPGGEVYGVKEIKNAMFIAEHASQSFEHARKFADAKEMAYIDSLTNLYNGKYLEIALDRELKRAMRLMMPVTALFLDLDNFKMINDRNDHLVGSKVLVEIAKILLQNVRDVDTVVRYGGDEYVIVLVDAGHEMGMRVAERIRLAIANHNFLKDEGLDVRVTASIGMATFPIHTRDKKELLKMADKAMYHAKDISRNTVYLAPVPKGAGE